MNNDIVIGIVTWLVVFLICTMCFLNAREIDKVKDQLKIVNEKLNHRTCK